MKPEITIAIITSASTLIAAIVSIIMNNRTLGYKVDELTKKVEKHNTLIERVALLELETTTQWKRIDELHDDVEVIKKEGK